MRSSYIYVPCIVSLGCFKLVGLAGNRSRPRFDPFSSPSPATPLTHSLLLPWREGALVGSPSLWIKTELSASFSHSGGQETLITYLSHLLQRGWLTSQLWTARDPTAAGTLILHCYSILRLELSLARDLSSVSEAFTSLGPFGTT